MESFATHCSNDKVKQMLLNAKTFVKDATEQWNPLINEPTESAYLGLIGIDESASKECGTILLDLLLRAGVLEQTNEGRWNLAANWKERCVSLWWC